MYIFSRFAFFQGDVESDESGMTSLMKSDKDAFESLSAIIRLEDSDENPLEDHVIDYKEVDTRKR